jgi:hypothetical protein
LIGTVRKVGGWILKSASVEGIAPVMPVMWWLVQGQMNLLSAGRGFTA